MAYPLIQHTLTICALLSTALAQTSSTIPQDLSTGFNKKEVQVSFTNSATNGFKSGTVFSRDAVANEPTFALGDSNGIAPSTRYTLIMVDTTCPSARTLHYVRSNFQFSFAGGTNIETEAAPLLDYKAPGALGESGDGRQYVFLMYTNPQRREIAEMQLPVEGAVFDVKKFQADNGLNDPVAGVGMVVQLGGTADCAGEAPNQVPDGVPTAPPATSSPATSSPATSSPATSSEATSTGARSSAAAPVQTASPSASAPAVSPTLSEGTGEQEPAPTTTAVDQVPAASSTALQTDDSIPTSAAPIPTLSSVRAPGSGSQTTSSAPLEQTANAAPDAFAGNGAFVAQILFAAGVLVW